MNKLILIAAASMMLCYACKKEPKKTSSSSTGSPTTQTWNGLYCMVFLHDNNNGIFDTLGQSCGNSDSMNYYSSHGNPRFPTMNTMYGKRIYNCNECH